MVSSIKPGTQVKLQIWRKGATRELALSVGEIPTTKVASERNGEADKSRLGLALRSLTPQERRQLESPDGLLVEGVSGPAARAGIRPGDVVVSVNGQPVRDVPQLRAMLERAGKNVALLIERENARIFVPVELG